MKSLGTTIIQYKQGKQGYNYFPWQSCLPHIGEHGIVQLVYNIICTRIRRILEYIIFLGTNDGEFSFHTFVRNNHHYCKIIPKLLD